MATPYLVYCTPEGEIREEPRLQALAFGMRPLAADELIPLPDGVTLSMMPDRLAVGQKRNGEYQVISSTRGWAAAALLPIGYTRTLLPAYEKVPGTEPLPFFGYSAVAGINGRLYVAALKTDDPRKWHPRAFNGRILTHLVREKQAAFPRNRIVAQHAHCALDYSCPTASNLFFGRWEMAIAVSPGCNARWLQRLYDAGLDTIRASTISGHSETYTAYYRPLGYSFEDVKESLKRARDAGVYSSINLLSLPGMIDREREVEALLSFVKET